MNHAGQDMKIRRIGVAGIQQQFYNVQLVYCDAMVTVTLHLRENPELAIGYLARRALSSGDFALSQCPGDCSSRSAFRSAGSSRDLSFSRDLRSLRDFPSSRDLSASLDLSFSRDLGGLCDFWSSRKGSAWRRGDPSTSDQRDDFLTSEDGLRWCEPLWASSCLQRGMTSNHKNGWQLVISHSNYWLQRMEGIKYERNEKEIRRNPVLYNYTRLNSFRRLTSIVVGVMGCCRWNRCPGENLD